MRAESLLAVLGLATVGAFTLLGCGDDASDDQSCAAGTGLPCTCADGRSGIQRCTNGTWGTCSCGPDDTGGSAGTGGSPAVCTPGRIEFCTGPGDCSGVQQCLPDGTGYGPCDCTTATGGSAGEAGSGGDLTGGSGGSGGDLTGGSGGSGGTTGGSGGSGGTTGGTGGSGGALGGTGGSGGSVGGTGGTTGGTGGTTGDCVADIVSAGYDHPDAPACSECYDNNVSREQQCMDMLDCIAANQPCDNTCWTECRNTTGSNMVVDDCVTALYDASCAVP